MILIRSQPRYKDFNSDKIRTQQRYKNYNSDKMGTQQRYSFCLIALSFSTILYKC